MFKSIEVRNIRGVTGELKLSQRTLLVGPNGVGKSAHLAGMNFAMLGKLPGYKPSEAFANASDEEMYAKAVYGERTIERKLVQGKTLSESLAIDGNWAKGKGMNARIEDALGAGPKVLDMPAFFECTPAQKRRMILGMVCDKEKLNDLMDKEEKARKAKNDAVDDRRAADKAVDEITQQQAEMEKPVGNLKKLKEELKEKRLEYKEVSTKIEKGKANDEARKAVSTAIDDIPKLKRKIEANEKALEDAQVMLAKSEKKVKAHEKKKPVCDIPDTPPQPILDNLFEIAREISVLMESGEHMSSEAAEVIQRIHNTLVSMIPDADKIKEFEAELKDWCNIGGTLDVTHKELHNNVQTLLDESVELGSQLESAQSAQTDQKNIGDGLDPNDEATLRGIDERIAELEGKIAPLDKIKTLDDTLERVRLKAEKSYKEEEEAKNNLAIIEKEQAEIVEEATEMLGKRSKEILPIGNLKITLEGKNILIYWAKSKDLKVLRTSLSGSEQALFDVALGHALAPKATIILEAAELDNDNLIKAMTHLEEADCQIVIATCHEPDISKAPESWNIQWIS